MGKIKYISIHNNDNKKWIIPTQNTKIALGIYQPSSLKGNLVKFALPIIVKIPVFKWFFINVVKAHECVLDIPEKVSMKIEEIFGKKELTISYFSGTPCVHQKEVLQVARKNQIVGYIKYSKSELVNKQFLREIKLLEYLKGRQFHKVPKVLFCSNIESDYYFFAQDTKKTIASKNIHKFSKYHKQFLDEMYYKTRIKCDYQCTDYYKNLRNLESMMTSLPILKDNYDLLHRAIVLAEKELCMYKYFSFYHGDFTPWNCIIENDELFAFDFEYAEKSFPPYLDIFHYFTQTMIFEKKATTSMILEEFDVFINNSILEGVFNNVYISYIHYLLNEIQLFAYRDGEYMKEVDYNNLQIWIRLIEEMMAMCEKR